LIRPADYNDLILLHVNLNTVYTNGEISSCFLNLKILLQRQRDS